MNEQVLKYLVKHTGTQDILMPFFVIEPEYLNTIMEDATDEFLDELDISIDNLEHLLTNHSLKESSLAGRINVLLHRLVHLQIIYRTIIVEPK